MDHWATTHEEKASRLRHLVDCTNLYWGMFVPAIKGQGTEEHHHRAFELQFRIFNGVGKFTKLRGVNNERPLAGLLMTSVGTIADRSGRTPIPAHLLAFRQLLEWQPTLPPSYKRRTSVPAGNSLWSFFILSVTLWINFRIYCWNQMTKACSIWIEVGDCLFSVRLII